MFIILYLEYFITFIIIAGAFQFVFILLGVCAGGQFSRGLRGKDAALDAACRYGLTAV